MDKEREIRFQFLDEAQDHLGTLDTALLGLADNKVDLEAINAALRAAHSIKGGAGMMGFQVLSQLAHRMEDSFKVLKTRKNSVQIDGQLEGLLLSGVNCLRHVIDCNRQELPPEPEWVETKANPIFDQLYEQLGDPHDEHAGSMIAPDDGQEDLISLLFETEVEGCLQRLEDVLADPDQPCLREEVDLLAQELGGLAEMLQIEAFGELCQSITQQLEAAPEQLQETANAALQAWRHSQALILTQQLSLLPTALELSVGEVTPIAEVEPVLEADSPPQVEPEPTQALDTVPTNLDQVTQSLGITDIEELEPLVWEDPAALTATDFKEIKPDEREAEPSESQDTTVRVPVKQLEQLNDLFGELIIERNSLSLQLDRLRQLMDTLGRRVQSLEQSNNQIRTTYDKTSTNSSRAIINPIPAVQPAVNLRQNGASPQENFLNDERLPKFDLLEMDRYDSLHLLSQQMMEAIVQIQEVTSDVQISLDDTEQTARDLNKTARQLQNNLTQVRMRPLSDILQHFPRAMRELSLQHDKPIELKIIGDNTLVDRNVLEVLNDPMMHLLRNAFDHGIEDPQTRQSQGKPEKGTIEIQASHRSNRTLITIRDDGKGIPLEKIRARAEEMGLDQELLASATDQDLLSLIFEPGFTTSKEVTDLSGRGVGMDVVRSNLQEVQGEIQVDTQPGQGTTFTLSLPFTLSVTRVLLAESNGMVMAFPSDAIQEILALPSQEIIQSAGSEILNLDGTPVQLIRLQQWLKFYNLRRYQELEATPMINTPSTLITSRGDLLFGIVINRCWGEQEIAIRHIQGDLPLPIGFDRCTILGDGQVVPVVNIPELLDAILNQELTAIAVPLSQDHKEGQNDSQTGEDDPNSSLSTIPPQQKILIIDDSINVRRFLSLTLEKAGYLVEQARDGQDALDKLEDGLRVQGVICDLEMPRLDGYGFLAQVKANPKFQQVPVAMLTSRAGDKHRRLAMTLGASAYFSKPYNEQELLKTLEEIINASFLVQD